MRRGLIRLLFVVAVAALLSGCASTTGGGAVGAERKQLLLVSSQQLDALAAQNYSKLQSDAAHKGALNSDPAQL